MFELLAVCGLVLGPVVHPDGANRDPGGVARAHLVRHDQDQVGVRDLGHGEWPLTVTLVTVSQNTLQGSLLLQCILVELIEVSLLVAGLWLGLVNVGHLQKRDRATILDLEVIQHLLSVFVIRLVNVLDIGLLAVGNLDHFSTPVEVPAAISVVLLLVVIVGRVRVGIGVVQLLLWGRPGVSPVWVPEVVDLEPDDGPGHLAQHPVEHPGDELEWGEQDIGGATIIRALQTDCLVIVDFDLVKHVVLLEAVEDSAVDFSEELADVVGILRYDDKAIVVQDVTLNRLVLAR